MYVIAVLLWCMYLCVCILTNTKWPNMKPWSCCMAIIICAVLWPSHLKEWDIFTFNCKSSELVIRWPKWRYGVLECSYKYRLLINIKHMYDDSWYCLYLLVCIFSSIQVFKFLKAYSSIQTFHTVLLLCKCNAVDRFHNICIIMECYNLEWY